MDRISQFIFEHRRVLAAVFAGLAVLTALTAVRQAPVGEPVLAVRHDLRSGHVVSAADLRTRSVPPEAVPDHALDRREAIGRRVAGPMRQGELLTDFRVLQAGSLAGYGSDVVFTTIRVDRADGATGVRVGDRVDVIAVDPDGESKAEVVARDVEVVTVPTGQEEEVAALGIVTSEASALALATAALRARFSVITTS